MSDAINALAAFAYKHCPNDKAHVAEWNALIEALPNFPLADPVEAASVENVNPLADGFPTVETRGDPNPEKRRSMVKIEFSGELAAKKAHDAMDYLNRLVKADQAAYPLAVNGVGGPAGGYDLHAIAKDAAERVHKNGGCVPQLAFAPILWALQDALTSEPQP